MTEQIFFLSEHENNLCFCLQVVEDMLEDEEEEDDKDDKVIIFPALGTGCGRCKHDTVFTDS